MPLHNACFFDCGQGLGFLSCLGIAWALVMSGETTTAVSQRPSINEHRGLPPPWRFVCYHLLPCCLASAAMPVWTSHHMQLNLSVTVGLGLAVRFSSFACCIALHSHCHCQLSQPVLLIVHVCVDLVSVLHSMIVWPLLPLSSLLIPANPILPWPAAVELLHCCCFCCECALVLVLVLVIVLVSAVR